MKLSIIVPAYNVELYLKRCIDSVFRQGLEDFEVLIINDGSKDSTLKLAKELEEEYSPFIKVLDQENKGLSAVRNRGVEVARGKYVIFLDSDDFYNSNCLSTLLCNCLDSDLDVLEFGYELNFNGSFKEVTLHENELRIFEKEEFIETYYFTPFAVNKIIKRKLLTDIGLKFVEGKLMEDDYFSTELYLNCNKIGVVNLVVYNYFHNPDSIRKVRNKQHELKVVEDLIFSLNQHCRLFEEAKNIKLSSLALRNLRERRESIYFFMIIRMLKLGLGYEDIQVYFDRVDINRITIFPNLYRGSKKQKIMYKVLVKILNNKLLFKGLVNSKIFSYL